MAEHNDPTRKITPRPGEDVTYQPHRPHPADDVYHTPTPPHGDDIAHDRPPLRHDDDVLYETHTHHEGDVHGRSVHRRGESADVEVEVTGDEKPERLGDILGISDAPPEVQIPKPADPGSGNAPGLDVRTPASGFGELKRGTGATGIDMGGGGHGTDVDPRNTRRDSGA